MSAYKHSPFRLSPALTVSRCISTRLRTYPPIGGIAPGRAKYTEHKRSLCDGCISLSNAEGFIRCCLSVPCFGLCFSSWAYPPFLFARIRAYPVCFIPISLPIHTPDLRSTVFPPDTILSPNSFPFWSLPTGHPPELPYTLRSEIPYQSISPLITIHICHFHSYNLIFLLSLHSSPFQVSPCLLSTGACHAPVLIIKEELPTETLRHSSSVQILFFRPFPFFLCRGSFEFSIQVTHDHLVQFLL